MYTEHEKSTHKAYFRGYQDATEDVKRRVTHALMQEIDKFEQFDEDLAMLLNSVLHYIQKFK